MIRKFRRRPGVAGAVLVAALLLAASFVSPAFGGPGLSLKKVNKTAKKGLKAANSANQRSKSALNTAKAAGSSAATASNTASAANNNAGTALNRSSQAVTAANNASDGAGDVSQGVSDDVDLNSAGDHLATAECPNDTVPTGGGATIYDTQGTPDFNDDTIVGDVPLAQSDVSVSVSGWDAMVTGHPR